ncbi:MAG: hypothetical protein AUJ31_02605 [Parcubacteria group bacterium CG1_02_39_15]|nr:MAG: hypothetical protein AUJ31_02605 [Parcubacteria group bacterium CG1_02_39_15]
MKRMIVFLSILLVVALIFVGCTQSTPPQQNKEGLELTTKSQTIAVLIDQETYSQAKPEIERYVEDIKNDLQAKVFLYHQKWQSPQEVREQLLSLKDDNLKGAVLIGEIPYVYFETSICHLEPEFVSDRYYMDLENSSFTDEDNDGRFEEENYKGSLTGIIWVGRIKPPVGGVEGINLLKNYFERNHQYRAGEISPTEELLLYAPNIQQLPPPMIQEGDKMVEGTPRVLTLEKYLENIRDQLTLHGSSDILYLGDEIDILVNASRDEYLEALQRDYEIVSFHSHGTAAHHVLEDFGETISAEDIKNAEPKSYFYFLYSCSAGDFTQENYIGGHYLFNGNGLMIYAPTAPSMAGVGEIREHIQPLALGLTFGEVFVLNNYGGIGSLGFPNAILGDPTLRIRPKIGTPRIEVDVTEIDFGEIKIDFGKLLKESQEYPYAPPPEDPLKNFVKEEVIGEGTIRIENVGTGKVVLRSWHAYLINEKGARAEISVEWKKDLLLPEENATWKFTFVPSEEGNYTGLAVINTNDPDCPTIVIELRGKGI